MLTKSSNISSIEDMWKNLVVTIDVEICPLGFQLLNKRCDCDSRLLKTSLKIECSISNEVIILTDSRWLSYEDGLLRTLFDCPLVYCLQKNTNLFFCQIFSVLIIVVVSCVADVWLAIVWCWVVGSVGSAHTCPVITLSG